MRLVLLLVAVGLSGCSGPVALDPVARIAVGTSDDCTEIDLFVLVDKPHLQSQLPPGYLVADTQRLLGTPQSTDMGAVSVLLLDCEDHRSEITRSRHAQLNILVDPPRPQEEPVTFEFYEITRWTDDAESLPLSVLGGWNVTAGRATIDWNVTVLGRAADALIETSAPVAGFSLNSSAGEVVTLRTRYWQELPSGQAFTESRIHTTAWRGFVECSFEERSPPAHATKRTQCALGQSFAVLLPKFQLEWRAKSLSGA